MSAAPPGESSSALTGVHRVGVALPKDELRVRLAGTLGYGLTEAQSDTDSVHHRASAVVAGAVSPVSWLDLGLRVDARYDVHGGDEGGSDGGVLDSRLVARVSSLVSSHFYLGSEVVAWLPGSEDASTSFDSTTFDLRALLGWHEAQVTVGGLLGFRLDRSRAAGKNADRLSSGDRLALGLSEHNAILLGVAGAYRLGSTELLAEASVDWLIGAEAPPFVQSPLRVAVGARQRVGQKWAIEALLEGSLSARPGLETGAALIPVEPRLTLLLGVRFDPLNARAPSVEPTPARSKPLKAAPPPAVTPTTVALEVTVTGPDGTPVTDAEVFLVVGDASQPLLGDGLGIYRLDQAPVGKATLRVQAPGLQPTSQELTLRPGDPAKLKVAQEQALPVGQIRGLIRSLRGKGLAASVEVEPLGLTAAADANGFFQVDAPPGQYTLVLTAPGYRTQRRVVNVQKNGVVVINVDLAEGR